AASAAGRTAAFPRGRSVAPATTYTAGPSRRHGADGRTRDAGPTPGAPRPAAAPLSADLTTGGGTTGTNHTGPDRYGRGAGGAACGAGSRTTPAGAPGSRGLRRLRVAARLDEVMS